MEDLRHIEKAVSKARAQLYLNRFWVSFWRALFWGAIASLVWTGIYKFAPLPASALPIGYWVSLAVFTAFILIGIWKRPSKKSVAAILDEQQGLQERISTALEWAKNHKDSSWKSLVVKDAVSALDKISWNTFVSYHLPLTGKWAFILLLLIAGLGFVPEYRSQEFEKKEAFKEIAQETGEELAKVLTQKMETRPENADELSDKLIQDGIELANQIGKTKLTKSSALRKLDELADQVKDDIEKLGTDPSQQRMKEAADKAASFSNPSSTKDMMEKMNDLENKLGDLQDKPDKLNDFADAMKDLNDLAQGMNASLNDPNSAESEALAEAMENLLKEMEEMGIDASKLQDALNALKEGDAEAFEENLDFATKDLEKMMEMMKNLQNMQQEIGKDLAEQLEKGQIPMAQETLKQMQEQLEMGDLSDEERQEMVQELMDAAEAMEGFPELQQQLMEAANNVNEQQDQAAQENMQAAMENLNQMMEDLQNAADMEEVLAALKKAGAAMAAGKKWQRGKGDNPNGRGQGMEGGLGGGFGTWSDGTDPLPAEKSQLVDQSGMTQQELESRGITEREESFEDERFTSEQIKGDLSPGSAMPSIPLHGLHIKGQSKVSYEEVMTEIQSSEAGTIDQTKIPRHYQESVKSYFDN